MSPQNSEVVYIIWIIHYGEKTSDKSESFHNRGIPRCVRHSEYVFCDQKFAIFVRYVRVFHNKFQIFKRGVRSARASRDCKVPHNLIGT